MLNNEVSRPETTTRHTTAADKRPVAPALARQATALSDQPASEVTPAIRAVARSSPRAETRQLGGWRRVARYRRQPQQLPGGLTVPRMTRPTYAAVALQIEAPMFVKGCFRRCWQTSDGPLG